MSTTDSFGNRKLGSSLLSRGKSLEWSGWVFQKLSDRNARKILVYKCIIVALVVRVGSRIYDRTVRKQEPPPPQKTEEEVKTCV